MGAKQPTHRQTKWKGEKEEGKNEIYIHIHMQAIWLVRFHMVSFSDSMRPFALILNQVCLQQNFKLKPTKLLNAFKKIYLFIVKIQHSTFNIEYFWILCLTWRYSTLLLLLWMEYDAVPYFGKNRHSHIRLSEIASFTCFSR